MLHLVFAFCGLLLGFALCVLLGRLAAPKKAPELAANAPAALFSDTAALPARSENSVLVGKAYLAADALREGNFSALASMVHPEYGLTFSPYADVNLVSARCFTAAQVAALGTDDTEYVWGVYDGSGEPIQLTAADYFARFVYDRDYCAAPRLGVDQVLRSGNALENAAEIFSGARFVELHDPGEPDNEQDWRTLRLVFEDYEGSLYLSAVIHSEWTA